MAKRTTKSKPSKRSKTLYSDVVTARAFVLVDENGFERASLSTLAAQGLTMIQINSDDGLPALRIQVDRQGANICLLNGNKSNGISLATSQHGNGLFINGEDSEQYISVGIPGPKSDQPGKRQPDITIIDVHNQFGWSALNGKYELPMSKQTRGNKTN